MKIWYSVFILCQNFALVASQKNKSAHNKTFNCKDDLYCRILSLIKKKEKTFLKFFFVKNENACMSMFAKIDYFEMRNVYTTIH